MVLGVSGTGPGRQAGRWTRVLALELAGDGTGSVLVRTVRENLAPCPGNREQGKRRHDGRR